MPRLIPTDAAEAVRMLRAQLDWTQSQFGAATSASRQLVSKWESGESSPSLDAWGLMLDTPTHTEWLLDFLISQLQGRAA